jgi:sulfur carrier protein ThiS
MGETLRATILPNRETRDVRATDAGQLLRELGLQQDAYIVIRDDQILTRDVRLGADDKVEVWPVISGG